MTPVPRVPRQLLATLVLSLLTAALPAASTYAERPTAAHLFPKETVAYLRVTDALDFSQQMKESSLGRIGEEEGIKQFVRGLYDAAEAAYADVEQDVGLSLEELLKLPQGEIAIGVIQPKEGQPKTALLVEVGDYEVNARKLMERTEEIAKRNGGSTSSEVFKEVRLNLIDRNRAPDGNLTWFIKDETVVISNSTEVCRQMLEAWGGVEDVDTLADNTDFATIMKRCSGQDDARPQLTWFVDAINLTRTIARAQGAGLALAFIPATGLDGVRGIGGSAIMNTEDFESVQHMHILLDTPRSGLVDALALSSGETAPEGWVPPDVASYMTMHWDFNRMYLAIEKVYDSFTSEGQLNRDITGRFDENVGASFFEEILPALEGRVTMCTLVVDPPRWNSQANLIGVKVNDAALFQQTLDKVMAKFPAFEKERFGATEYYAIQLPDGANGPFGDTLRRPEPCFCLLGDYLLYTDSVEVLEQAVVAHNDPTRSLAKQADYQRIAERVNEHLGGERPGLFTFSRPDKILKLFYELSQTEQTREFLAEGADQNRFVARLGENLQRNKLPPFSVVARHLLPAGAVMTNDETGLHYMAFSLKPESE